MRAARLARGWTLEYLSAELGKAGYPLSIKVLSKTENALRTISVSDLVAFASVLGLTLKELTTSTSDAESGAALADAIDKWESRRRVRDDAKGNISVLVAQLAVADSNLAVAQGQMRDAGNDVRDLLSAASGVEMQKRALTAAQKRALTVWMNRHLSPEEVAAVRHILAEHAEDLAETEDFRRAGWV